MDYKAIRKILTQKVKQYNRPGFIKDDPISIPHKFSKKQDIEIAAFFSSLLAWGNRKTIINSCTRLFTEMDNAPHDFVINFQDKNFKPFQNFVHRTFNSDDLYYLLSFLQKHYKKNESLETAFIQSHSLQNDSIENALNGFYHYVFNNEDEFLQRTKKHIAAPFKKSTCKKLNMFLRWMVRCDNNGVDFGLWKNILPHQLICPVDIHVARVARSLHLLKRKQTDWLAAVELTEKLKTFDASDPVKYDFALFSMGAVEKY